MSPALDPDDYRKKPKQEEQYTRVKKYLDQINWILEVTAYWVDCTREEYRIFCNLN